jgi:hypothetical protein
MKKIIRIAFFILLSLLINFNLAYSQEFTIGVEDLEYYPLYTNKNGNYSGFARDLFDKFASDNNIKITYKSLPIKRLFNDFITGDVDFKFPDNAFWDQDAKQGKYVIYSDPVLNYIDGVSVLNKNKGNSYQTLGTIGIINGFTAWEYSDGIKNGQIKLLEENSFDPLIAEAEKDRISGIYGNVAVFQYHLKTLNKANEMIFDSLLPFTKNSYKLSTIKYPIVINLFNNWYSANGKYIQQLKDKYGAEEGVGMVN